jgi:hypothetical protein
MVHVLNETDRHTGHAGILREQLDNTTNTDPTVDWPAQRARIAIEAGPGLVTVS